RTLGRIRSPQYDVALLHCRARSPNAQLLQRTPHHASAAVAVSKTGPEWRNRDRGGFVEAAVRPTAIAAKPVDAPAATSPIPRAVSPWRNEPDRRSAHPTVRKAMVVRCHVTWIISLVVRGPPKALDGSTSGDSFLTTRTSPPTPWIAAPRMARDPATISGAFTPHPRWLARCS